jgi:hypothetical protein
MITPNQIKNNPHIEIIQLSDIDKNLSNLEQRIGVKIGNEAFLKDTLNMVREINDQIE